MASVLFRAVSLVSIKKCGLKMQARVSQRHKATRLKPRFHQFSTLAKVSMNMN